MTIRTIRWYVSAVIVALALQAGTANVYAEKTAAVQQTTCPVMGGEINKSLYVDHDGKRIYVCCQGCVATMKKDPAKYIKMLEEQGITLDPVPDKEK